MERLFATPKMIPFLSLSMSVSGCSAFRSIHQRFVLATFYPLQYLRHAPNRKRMRQARPDHICPEPVQRLLVVVLLKVACLREKLIVINSRNESTATQLHHRATDDVRV